MFDSKLYIKCTRTAQGGGASLHPRSASVDSVKSHHVIYGHGALQPVAFLFPCFQFPSGHGRTRGRFLFVGHPAQITAGTRMMRKVRILCETNGIQIPL